MSLSEVPLHQEGISILGVVVPLAPDAKLIPKYTGPQGPDAESIPGWPGSSLGGRELARGDAQP